MFSVRCNGQRIHRTGVRLNRSCLVSCAQSPPDNSTFVIPREQVLSYKAKTERANCCEMSSECAYLSPITKVTQEESVIITSINYVLFVFRENCTCYCTPPSCKIRQQLRLLFICLQAPNSKFVVSWSCSSEHST